MRFVVGITGASGVRLGVRFAAHLARLQSEGEIFLIFSDGAKMVEKYEENGAFEGILAPNVKIISDKRLDFAIASGSFKVEATAIVPCSANSLAKIACGICDTLISRAACVALKERRTLLLAPREMPLNAIIAQNMLTLANAGAIIAPPVLAYYANIANLADLEDFLCGKWLDLLGISHNLYARWGEDLRDSRLDSRDSRCDSRFKAQDSQDSHLESNAKSHESKTSNLTQSREK